MSARERLRRYWFPIGFAALLALVSVVAAMLPQSAQDWLVAQTSTNLANLTDWRLDTLLTSAFVAGDWLWAVPLCVVAALALSALVTRFGTRRAIILVTLAHVIGTAVSELILGLLIAAGQRPVDDRYVEDVGPSYVIMGALVAVVLYGRFWRSRVACLVIILAMLPSIVDGITTLDLTALGHGTAMLTGAATGFAWQACRGRESARRGTPRDELVEL